MDVECCHVGVDHKGKEKEKCRPGKKVRGRGGNWLNGVSFWPRQSINNTSAEMMDQNKPETYVTEPSTIITILVSMTTTGVAPTFDARCM
jgi:hypothetical protein